MTEPFDPTSLDDLRSLHIQASINPLLPVEEGLFQWSDVPVEKQAQVRKLWDDFQEWDRNTPGTYFPTND